MLSAGWVPGPPQARQGRGRARLRPVVLFVLLVVVVASIGAVAGNGRDAGAVDRPDGVDAVLAASAPTSWDPARISDAGSAGTLTQVFDSLTALDADNQVQPALATHWETSDGGRQMTFHMRDGITFSDGRPITAGDVVNSWLRVLDPAHPSPLADLLGDVDGALAYAAGTGARDEVGIKAVGDTVVVTFRRPASYFASTAASPTLAIVPPDLPATASGPLLPSGLVVSGAYIPTDQSTSDIQLEANQHYWAGKPSLQTISLLTSLDDRSPVDVFQAGDVDYVDIARDDATWIGFDPSLGPELRENNNLSVAYYGFDTTRPPFDKADVRRAFAQAVDWRRIVQLDDATATPATSLVPPGVEGRGEGDFVLPYDPAAARASLAAAGYADGAGFPDVTIVTDGGGYEEAVVQQLKENLGITVKTEAMPFDEYGDRLANDPPQMWSLEWVADYPQAQDFLGLLLHTGSASNFGGWSDPAFDAALDAAASTDDPAEQARHYEDAQRIVREQVPVMPMRYGDSWALSRDGLLGAGETGVGFIRMAGLEWAGR